ncbi:MAG: UpxY family transcription antiterminator [Bacteroidales bacterium]|nr:UpxY family transcription antiterminator [Bacteroidales bacterium]
MPWYIAHTRSCQEHRIADSLTALGIESFIAEQEIVRISNGRKRRSRKRLLPGIVFINCEPTLRVPLMKQVYGIVRYMTTGLDGNPAVVHDDDMQLFISMVEQRETEATIDPTTLKRGDRVKIVNGSFSGMECEVLNLKSHHYIVARLSILGSALVEVPLSAIETIS